MLRGEPPLVTVLVPTHNRAHYLAVAIESVLLQTHAKFELIIVDDGSTDNTENVVDGYQDPRIRYIYQQNSGRSAARNLGISLARGDYIAFLDDDDLFEPDKLQRQVQYMEAEPTIDLVASGATLIDANGVQRGVWEPWKAVPELEFVRCLLECPLQPSCVICRRQTLDTMSEWFDPTLRLAEDKDLFLRLMLAGKRLRWMPALLTQYRIHDSNSQKDSVRYTEVNLAILNKLYSQYKLPGEAIARRVEIYWNCYLVGACRAFAAGQAEAAHVLLQRAFEISPELDEGQVSVRIAQILAAYASSFHVEDPDAFFEYMFDKLESDVTGLARYYRQARSYFYMQRVFADYKEKQMAHPRDWFYGVWYSPSWLLNRGVWSILFHSCVHGLLGFRNTCIAA